MYKTYIYIAIMALTIFLIRVLPLTLVRKKIENKTIRSFLYYVPYVTLSVMTFPAIINATGTIYSGIAALVAGGILAFLGAGLLPVAVASCAVVYVVEILL